jgi:hypothetical protein
MLPPGADDKQTVVGQDGNFIVPFSFFFPLCKSTRRKRMFALDIAMKSIGLVTFDLTKTQKQKYI